ncbi:hypothetical protein VUN82_21465 [Micrococcaceae bacterium Sec5.1]
MPDHLETTAVHNASIWGDAHLALERNVSMDATTAWRCSSESDAAADIVCLNLTFVQTYGFQGLTHLLWVRLRPQ